MDCFTNLFLSIMGLGFVACYIAYRVKQVS